MARCGECIHFKCCEPWVSQDESFPEVDGCNLFKDKNDFVPRAEVEKAKQEADRLAVELEAEKALREVRIERVFEEIYKTINSIYASVQHSCVGMHGDNPETMRLLGKLEGIKHLGDEIAELKKKYTEGE